MNTRIPDYAVTFIPSLVNIKKARPWSLMRKMLVAMNLISFTTIMMMMIGLRRKTIRKEIGNEEEDFHAIFQTMFYAINNAHRKAPLQLSLAHTIYGRCKDKERIRSTNNLAFTISYSELMKLRNNLGAKVFELSSLEWKSAWSPLRFNTDDFCIAVMDNMDHTDMARILFLFMAFLSAIKLFDEQCNKNSEQCRFWNNSRYVVCKIKNLVLAHGEGDFFRFPWSWRHSSIHYLRYGSFYLETLRSLKYGQPKLYAAFMKGDFVIKTSKGPFNAIASIWNSSKQSNVQQKVSVE